MAKLKLGVIFGSRSCEREVAIISAVQLMNNVDTEKYDVIPVYIDDHGLWFTGDALRKVSTFSRFNQDAPGITQVSLDMGSGSGALLATRPMKGLWDHARQVVVTRLDVCVIVMHGLNGEDGTLQGMLELANLPYTSTGVAGSAVGMDKIMAKMMFRGAGLPTLPGFGVTRSEYADQPAVIAMRVEEELGYPVFVKPANLGSSIGVSRANDPEELEDSLSLAFEYDRRVLIEKGLDRPVELNCSVMGFDDDVTASPIEMPVSAVNEEFLDFSKKYLENSGTKGMASLSRLLPAPIEDSLRDELQQLSCRVFRLLDCKGVVRIDYMFDKTDNSVWITEINTIPGSLAFYLWEEAGIPYARLIDRMVTFAMKAHREKNERSYAFTSDILRHVGGDGAKGAKGAKGGKLTSGAKLGGAKLQSAPVIEDEKLPDAITEDLLPEEPDQEAAFDKEKLPDAITPTSIAEEEEPGGDLPLEEKSL